MKIGIRLSNDSIELLINELEKQIKTLEMQNKEGFVLYCWLKQKHPDLIRDWVEFCYEAEPTLAKDFVSAYHDESLDLSTIPCTGDDFKPW